RSPWRRETPPSPGLVRAAWSPETKSPHDSETSQHRCGRAHEPRGPRRDLLLKGDEEPRTPKPKIELPERFRIRPVTPVEKYIKILPSPPVPKTTQGFIGWRARVPGLNKGLVHALEIRSCKGAYAKELSWPVQGIH
uniref:Uncharacterized protein n=1 Tax=Felis catus TaxID=9685 RepID=A0ABI7WCG8_FELCA